jgi:hypothetical protein
MAKRGGKAALEVAEDELDEEELEGDEDAGEFEEENPQTEQRARVAGFLKGLREQNVKAAISVKFVRILRPEDKSTPGLTQGYVGMFPSPDGKIPAVNLATIEEDIFSCFGGGVFDSSWFVDGEYQTGQRCRFVIDGPPKARGHAALVSSGAVQPGSVAEVLSDGNGHRRDAPMTQESVVALIAGVLEEKEKEGELRRLRRELAELKATPPQAQKQGESVADLVNLVFAKQQVVNRQVGEAESPELKALREQNQKTAAELERLRDMLKDREAAENRRRYQEIEEKLAKLSRPPKEKKSPLSDVMGVLAEAAVLDKAFTQFDKKTEDEDATSGLLDTALDMLRKPAEKAISKFAKKALRNMNRKMPQLKTSAQPGAQPGAQGQAQPTEAEIRAAWLEWNTRVFQNPQLVTDQNFVRDGLVRFGGLISKLISITERTQLVDFAKETLNDQISMALANLAPEEMNGALRTIAALRMTVTSLAVQSAAPPAPAPQPAGEVDEEDDEDDDEDPDEDDDEEGDEDDEEDDEDDEDDDDADDDVEDAAPGEVIPFSGPPPGSGPVVDGSVAK